MTEGTATTFAKALPINLDPSHPMYGFMIDTWVDQPIHKGPDWFLIEERYRRNANAHVYQQNQKGNQTKWNRYLTLGYFVFEDCVECDKVWEAIETDPLLVHRSIWYNFMCHVDRDLQIPIS